MVVYHRLVSCNYNFSITNTKIHATLVSPMLHIVTLIAYLRILVHHESRLPRGLHYGCLGGLDAEQLVVRAVDHGVRGGAHCLLAHLLEEEEK
jgi:hypothetical protein